MIHTKAKTFVEVLNTAKHLANKHNEERYIVCGPIVEYFSAFYPYAIYSGFGIDVENIGPEWIEAIVYPDGEVESWK